MCCLQNVVNLFVDYRVCRDYILSPLQGSSFMEHISKQGLTPLLYSVAPTGLYGKKTQFDYVELKVPNSEFRTPN